MCTGVCECVCVYLKRDTCEDILLGTVRADWRRGYSENGQHQGVGLRADGQLGTHGHHNNDVTMTTQVN